MNENIRPNGLKGRDVAKRMLDLMNINESKATNSHYAVELTKVGPDGKAYAIVRENQEFYIKIANKTTGLVLEDFQYIGGLQNKKLECHASYAKAIKRLNLKFLSINESFGGPRVDTFKDDNLLAEGAAGFAFGFANEVEEENIDEEIEMTEDEIAIDNMVEGLDPVGQEDGDVDNDGDEDESDDYLKNKRLKIGKAIQMGEAEEKASKLLDTLSEGEIAAILDELKKKV